MHLAHFLRHQAGERFFAFGEDLRDGVEHFATPGRGRQAPSAIGRFRRLHRRIDLVPRRLWRWARSVLRSRGCATQTSRPTPPIDRQCNGVQVQTFLSSRKVILQRVSIKSRSTFVNDFTNVRCLSEQMPLGSKKGGDFASFAQRSQTRKMQFNGRHIFLPLQHARGLRSFGDVNA